MLAFVTAGILVIVAAAALVRRRPFAEMQALVLGGLVLPGCVVAEAVALVALALLLVAAQLNGWI